MDVAHVTPLWSCVVADKPVFMRLIDCVVFKISPFHLWLLNRGAWRYLWKIYHRFSAFDSFFDSWFASLRRQGWKFTRSWFLPWWTLCWRNFNWKLFSHRSVAYLVRWGQLAIETDNPGLIHGVLSNHVTLIRHSALWCAVIMQGWWSISSCN